MRTGLVSPRAQNWGTGAGDGIRTRDIQLGRLALYRLSYSRSVELASRRRYVRSRWQFAHTISHLATSAMILTVPARSIMRSAHLLLSSAGGFRLADRRSVELCVWLGDDERVRQMRVRDDQHGNLEDLLEEVSTKHL